MYCTYSDSEVTFYILWNRKIPMSHQILTYAKCSHTEVLSSVDFISKSAFDLRQYICTYLILYFIEMTRQKFPKLRFR